MNERALAQAQRNEQAFRQYVQQTAAESRSMAKLAGLGDRGTISEKDFAQAKARLLGTQVSVTLESSPSRRAAVG